MHLRKGVLRSGLLSLALVALALPLSTQTASPVHAQINPPVSCAGGTYNLANTLGDSPTAPCTGVAFITAPGAQRNTVVNNVLVSFNVLGFAHTAYFTCAAGTVETTGCFDVTTSVTNDTLGTSTTINSATCDGHTSLTTGSTATCPALRRGANATVTINPGSPSIYSITFTGYVRANGDGTCPAGTGAGATSTTGGSSVTYTPTTGGTGQYCAFSVTSQKKYIEVTALTPVGGPCGGSVVWSEALKAYLGPGCTIGFAATGTVNVKTVADCPAELASISASNGSLAAPPEYGVDANGNPTAKYVCIGNQLAVSGVAVPAGIPLTVSVTNLGPPTGVTLGTGGSAFCTGTGSGTQQLPGTTVGSTDTVGNLVLCPTGFGPASFSACISSTINTQAPVCSVSTSVTFTLPGPGRTVPYVKWAGEKTVLTKCFGGGNLMSGAPVEFVLKGNNPGLNATLLPLQTPGTGSTTSASSDTVWTISDSRGCASVILYADGEGVAYVDAAIFSTTAAANTGAPIINEHAFEVFYLKFDHLDIENISSSTQSGAASFSASSAITPDLTFLTKAPAWPGLGGNNTLVSSVAVPTLPGTGTAAGGTVSIPVCGTDYIRSMVHGYFEIPGDPSGRPAASVTIPGAPSGAVGSFTLPAGRWVLPEDWPVLATFAGFTTGGGPLSGTGTASVYAWDINSGYAFNPTVEGAVLCTGPSTAPAPQTTGPITSFNTGPCFGYDVNNTPYSTAPALGCAGGATVGIGPFDITQACYNTFASDGTTVVTGSGLQYAPAGSNVLSANCGQGGPTFCTVPTSQNSTYLPNGTLSQWDAPMPPAQITFVNTGSTGTLSEVNKSGFYVYNLATGNSSSGAKPTPFYYNPFYAEAIPSSPAIPPVTNNGGYLWDSWGFHNATTAGVLSAAGSVAGETLGGAGITAGLYCPVNTTLSGGVCTTNTGLYTLAQCQAILGPTATLGTQALGQGTCQVAAYNLSASLGGGLLTSNFGTGCTIGGSGVNGSGTTFTVRNATGFVPGMTLEFYSSTTGNTLTGPTGLRVTNVTGNRITVAGTFNGCVPAYSAVAISQQFAIPLPSTASAAMFPANASVTLSTGTANATAEVSALGVVNGMVYLNGAEGIAQALMGCFLSRGPAGSSFPSFGACEPNQVLPAGTTVLVGATTLGGGVPPTSAPSNPYPFWQWVPSAAPTGGASSGTVYSDNHGEAIVALTTPFSTMQQSISPVPAGGCPAGYTTTTNAAGAAVGCILPLSQLGTAAFGGFANVATVNAAPAGTCFTTDANGLVSPAPTPTGTAGPVVGANGPLPGQICKNSLGAIEFGTGATIGSTTIQAIAEYPYTRGEHPQIASGVLTKVFTSAFVKSVSVSAGAPGPAGTTTYTVTVTAKDVCGNAITAEPIQVFALGNAGSVVLAPMAGTGGSAVSQSSSSAIVTVGASGTSTLSLEVLNTAVGTQGLVVKVVFPYENIERFATVIPGTTTPTFFQQTYGPGWNQVGGPAGSNFGVAEALFSFDTASGNYTDVTATSTNISSAAPNCTGYWAYFANAVSVNLPVTSNPTPATCTVAKGWVLLGNPFTTPATLPSGVTAYHWNGTAYVVTNQIPVGGSVWVDNTAGTLTSVVLTP